MMHLDLETTLNLIEGRLDAAQTELWNAHVQTCAGCSDQLNEWRSLSALLGGKHLASAPRSLLDKATALGRKSIERKVSILTKVMDVVFDSFAQPAFAGARGAGDARHLVLRTEEFDVHLRITGEREEHTMVGQILVRGEESFLSDVRVHLLREGLRIESTTSDYFGEFKFKRIPDGLLSLQIDLPNATVVGALNMMEGY